jgi:FkbH-like protein
MKLKIRRMEKYDICRVLELMTRTHQLNTTGWILEYKDLLKVLKNEIDNRIIYVAELDDKFGSYGIIGTAIIEININSWKLKYLAVSCRVMGRGIERAILLRLLCEAQKNGFDHADAEFYDTGKNRMMRALYQMLDFQLSEFPENSNGAVIFSKEIKGISNSPNWLEIV